MLGLLLGVLVFLPAALFVLLFVYVRSKPGPKGTVQSLEVAFVHPDLGIGGAERLVVDAALALKTQGHRVHMYTAHHDPGHCFVETRDGTIPVTVYGDWLPRTISGRMHAVCAYLRMCYASMRLVVGPTPYDVIICDQVSACIPIVRMSKSKVMFYCHYPDQLLATDRRSALKRLYRKPLDWLEEYTTGQADCVVVNSKFTAGVFSETFSSLTIQPGVLYPSINFSAFDNPQKDGSEAAIDDLIPPQATCVLLSINRYERKKNIQLAVDALAHIRGQVDREAWRRLHLVIAGGYDERVAENKEHYEELRVAAHDAGVTDHVTFVRSFTDAQKQKLLERCTCLLYTPDKEHFGIVPLEAMYNQRMVIAIASGGPLETVVNDVTGRHCDDRPQSWAKAIMETAMVPEIAERMGKEGRQRVIDCFSFAAFTSQLNSLVTGLVEGKDK